MKKKVDKKINWKKIAAVGGVFLLGAVVGGIGTEKILDIISLDDFSEFGCWVFKTTEHSALVRFTTTSPKTGRALNALLTEKDALRISQRTEIIKKLHKEYTQQDIAAILDVSQATVSSALHIVNRKETNI